MIYRDFGKTGLKVSALGFGAMRLDGDEEHDAAVVSRAVDLGVNYIDTSPGYCGGTSEVKVGKGVQGKRDKVYVANKCHPSSRDDAEGVRRVIETSLKRMGLARLDFYHLWYVDSREDYEVAMRKGGTWEGIKKAREEGLFDHIGITTHAPADVVRELIDSGEFETITLYHNLINRKYADMIDYAHQRGLGVIIMGPLGGGPLANPPAKVAEELGGKAAVIDSAMRFVWAHESISTVLSGVRTIDELEANVKSAENAGPLSEDDRQRMFALVKEMEGLGEDFCTQCGYCQPCEHGVAIPEVLSQLDYFRAYGLASLARGSIRKLEEAGKGPSLCVQCGECEPKCTQKLKIMELLEQAKGLIAE